MAKFFVVGFDSFHKDAPAESYSHSSQISLDDADAILFALPMAPFTPNTFQGKPSLGSDQSFHYKELIKRWSSELESAIASGKSVFVPLTSPDIVYVETGDVKTSGTGRNARRTRIVDQQSNLDVLPAKLIRVVTGVGDQFQTTAQSRVLANYWTRFSPLSQYEIRFAPQEWIVPLLTTNNPNQIVSAFVKYNGGGHLVLLPSIYLENSDTATFRVNCIDLVRHLLQVHGRLIGGPPNPPPDWAKAPCYETKAQRRLQRDLLQAQSAELRAQRKQEELQASLDDVSVLQGLLFAQGRPLEDAIIRGLNLMGVEAEGFADGESEFDAVFTIDGQRMLGEAEGRDSKAIAIGKITQLERNIAEDFARDGVDEYAHGVLFGNPQRLVTPDKRTETFTEKCISSAERNRFALVLTHTMFEPAAYLEESGDTEYAAKCRSALASAKGQVVEFPEIPAGYCSSETSEPKTSAASGG